MILAPMEEALRQAKIAYEEDEVPVGAVITHQKKIIARAYNRVETLKDPTAHAEMLAITQATSYLGTKWLKDCTLHVTIEPCSMCAGACVLARLDKIVYGAKDAKLGACGSVVNIAQHNALNHYIEIEQEVMAEECGGIISHFFQKKRILSKKESI